MSHFNDTPQEDTYVLYVPESMLFGQPMVDYMQQVLIFEPRVQVIRILVVDDTTRKITRGHTLEVNTERNFHLSGVDQGQHLHRMLQELLGQHSAAVSLH